MNIKRIVPYLILAYGISWIIWMPNVLSHVFHFSWGTYNWLHIVGGLGPFLAALITTYLFDKKQGVVKYFKEKLFRIQSVKWIMIGVGMPIVFFLIAILIAGVITGDWVVFSKLGLNSKIPLTNQVLIWLIWCLFYGLGEEGGWRGYLFPELIKGYKARIATLYVAFAWIPWHLPVFFYDKDFGAMGIFETIGWAVGLIFGSLLLGWLVKQAKFVLWPVILWHGTFNFFTTSERINPLIPGLMSFIVIIFAMWIARRYGDNLELERKQNEERIFEMGMLSFVLFIPGFLILIVCVVSGLWMQGWVDACNKSVSYIASRIDLGYYSRCGFCSIFTMVTETADQSYVGTALTTQLASGFMITIVTIQLIPVLKNLFSWQWAFAFLVPGPVVGILAMLRLKSLSEVVKIGGGKG